MIDTFDKKIKYLVGSKDIIRSAADTPDALGLPVLPEKKQHSAAFFKVISGRSFHGTAGVYSMGWREAFWFIIKIPAARRGRHTYIRSRALRSIFFSM